MLTQKELLKICQKEKISFEKIIRKSNRFILAKGRKGKDNVVLKILVNPQRKHAKKALIKEAKILELLNNLKEVKIRVPEFFGKNLKGKYPYFKEEFISGKILERKSGFFFKKLKRELIIEIARNLNNLIKTPRFCFREIKNLSNFSSFYFKEGLRLHKKIIDKTLTPVQKNKLKKLIKNQPKILVPVHGEVYPNNLIEDRQGKIYLLDWENFGFGNLAHDSASVYLRLKDKVSKEFFLKQIDFKNKRDFNNFFRIEIVLQSIGSLQYLKSQKAYFRAKRGNKVLAKRGSYFLEQIAKGL